MRLAIAAALLAATVALAQQRPQPPRPETIAAPGLSAPAEILIDRWGIPHIYGANRDDAFLAQGWNAARDRLWQIDLWRRRGLGLVSEVLGPDHVEQDRAARLFLYRGDMRAEWLAYGPEAKRIAEAFVAGINAYVRRVNADPTLLPFEFRVLDYRPAEWTVEDVVRIRSHGLTRNVTSEVLRARAACAGAGAEVDAIRRSLSPEWTPRMPEGLNPCDIPDDVLAVFTLATRSVPFTAAQRRADIEPWDDSTIGSNNWAIARGRTTTGRPILANDPHRAHGVPSLRYIAHVTYPGLSVIGAGEPALPGISIGHNGRVAFGLTIFAMDQEDLYVYETDPTEPEAYRYRDRFEAMRVIEESIPVRGEAPRRVTLKFTRHGPVLREDSSRNRAFALRTAWLEPGTAPYFGSVGYMRARGLDDFLAAMDGWGAPSENQVYADTEGNIALIPGGLQPIRRTWDGLFPVPGDGRHEWDGFLERDRLFARINPAEGFVHSANEMNLPRDFPIDQRRIGFEWADPSRADRITEAFLQRRRWSLDDAQALQMDVLSHHARRLVPLLLAAAASDPALAQDARALQGWDFRLTADSPAAALYETWFARFLRPAVIAATVPEALRRGTGVGDPTTIIALIEQPDARLPMAARDDLLRRTLRQAISHLAVTDGPRPLPWGSVHQVRFEHPLSALLDAAQRTRTTVGPAPMPGSGFTVQAATYATSGPGFRLTAGASFRMVLDVGNWDASRAVNTPGQSADPDSPHYRDLFEPWRTGRHVPLLYSRQAIERQTIRRIRLVPG